jgi:pimeloyl-ACP methyl ester carboxylesterase
MFHVMTVREGVSCTDSLAVLANLEAVVSQSVTRRTSTKGVTSRLGRRWVSPKWVPPPLVRITKTHVHLPHNQATLRSNPSILQSACFDLIFCVLFQDCHIRGTICDFTDVPVTRFPHRLLSTRLAFSMLLLNTSLLYLALAYAVTAINLPRPGGRFGTGTSRTMLVDHSRRDPFAAAAGITQDRRLMVSSFYPVALHEQCLDLVSPYMPEATALFLDTEYKAFAAPNNSFTSLGLVSCKPRGRLNSIGKLFPTVLFSPGLSNSRLLYSAMAQSLASEGFDVITIDHPYDADIVEFGDGSTALSANITSDEQILAALNVRVQDVSFVLDQLSLKITNRKLFGGRPCAKEGLYTMVGHSLGGATAVTAALSDKRLIGAINLDGSFFGKLLNKGAATPLMILSHDGNNLTTDNSWSAAWNATQEVTKVALSIEGTAHGSYTDLPSIVDALNFPEDMRRQLDPFIDTLPGTYIRSVVAGLVKQFTTFVRCESKSPLPRLKDAKYSHVNVLEENTKQHGCK